MTRKDYKLIAKVLNSCNPEKREASTKNPERLHTVARVVCRRIRRR
jgi:hypothetical protein